MRAVTNLLDRIAQKFNIPADDPDWQRLVSPITVAAAFGGWLNLQNYDRRKQDPPQVSTREVVEPLQCSAHYHHSRCSRSAGHKDLHEAQTGTATVFWLDKGAVLSVLSDPLTPIATLIPLKKGHQILELSTYGQTVFLQTPDQG